MPQFLGEVRFRWRSTIHRPRRQSEHPTGNEAVGSFPERDICAGVCTCPIVDILGCHSCGSFWPQVNALFHRALCLHLTQRNSVSVNTLLRLLLGCSRCKMLFSWSRTELALWSKNVLLIRLV